MMLKFLVCNCYKVKLLHHYILIHEQEAIKDECI